MSRFRNIAVRGLTLLEVLVTMLLLAMALGMVATLVRNFSSVSAHLEGKEGTQQGTLLLLSVAAELEEAFEITQPLAGTTTTVTEIRLRKYASAPARLTTGTTPNTWNPYILSVRYFLDGEDLVREVTFPPPGNEVRLSRISKRINGFSATRVNDQEIEVRATFRESKKLETVAASAYRWRDE
jgi:hypothetical protein